MGLVFLLVSGVAAEAAEIKVLTVIAIQQVLEDVGPKFERATGNKLVMRFATLGGITTNSPRWLTNCCVRKSTSSSLAAPLSGLGDRVPYRFRWCSCSAVSVATIR